MYITKSHLTVVGLGIKFLSHVSSETKSCLTQSDKLLYLVNEPLTKEWLQMINPSSESLDALYANGKSRLDSYRAITEYIIETLRKFNIVCVALYGHPTVFAQPALEAIKIAQEQGTVTKILPAISAEDCLFADLQFDPGSSGCQSFETTDFLIHRRNFDVNSHLVLWQVGILGNLGHGSFENNKTSVLVDYLKFFYPLSKKVVVYEAALYPEFNPRIEKVSLQELSDIKLSRITTLYIPPLGKAVCDEKMLKLLDIKITDLRCLEKRDQK